MIDTSIEKIRRWSNFNGSPKTIAASGLTSFTGNDAPSSGVVAYHIVTTGAGNNLTNATRLRLKTDGQTIYDVDVTHFRKFFERFTQANTAPALGVSRFTIPTNFCDIIEDELADVCQFPPGTVPTIEVQWGAGAAAGNAFIGWTQSNQDCHYTPMLLGQALNLGASQNAAQVPINVAGDAEVRGVIMHTTAVGTWKIELNQFLFHQCIGALYLTVATGDMGLEGDSWEDPATITTQCGRRIPMVNPTTGISRLIVDTGAGFAATAEYTLWMAHPIG